MPNFKVEAIHIRKEMSLWKMPHCAHASSENMLPPAAFEEAPVRLRKNVDSPAK